jgi:hypothetical protein
MKRKTAHSAGANTTTHLQQHKPTNHGIVKTLAIKHTSVLIQGRRNFHLRGWLSFHYKRTKWIEYYSRKFEGVQFSRIIDLTAKLNPRNKHHCTVYNGHDRSRTSTKTLKHPLIWLIIDWKFSLWNAHILLIHVSFLSWKFPAIRYSAIPWYIMQAIRSIHTRDTIVWSKIFATCWQSQNISPIKDFAVAACSGQGYTYQLPTAKQSFM